jgi:hypothetical protein
MTSASLSAFALLGVLSTVDECYHGQKSTGMQPVRELVEAGNHASEEEIGQEVRDWTDFHRCWQKIDRFEDLAESVARLCTAIAGPL